MSPLFAFFLGVGATVAVGGAVFLYVQKIYRKETYENRLMEFEVTKDNIGGRPIVFLGDSLTEMFPLKDFFPTLNVVNRGIYGDTTDGVLNRLEEGVIALNPTKIFLLIGTNDIEMEKEDPTEHILKNYELIIGRIKNGCPDAALFVESLLPISRHKMPAMDKILVGKKRDNELIAEINEGIQALAQKYNLEYIDVDSVMKDENGELKVDYTIEGLHLNALGYKEIVGKLMPYINQ